MTKTETTNKTLKCIETKNVSNFEYTSNMCGAKEITFVKRKSRLRFMLNDVPMYLCDIVKTVVTNYTEMHPNEDDITVKEIFTRECRGTGISHIIETEADYKKRMYQVSASRTIKKVFMPNGQVIYVSNQLRAGHNGQNFFRFIDVVHRNKWGVITRINA